MWRNIIFQLELDTKVADLSRLEHSREWNWSRPLYRGADILILMSPRQFDTAGGRGTL